jgi:hypothetical protein
MSRNFLFFLIYYRNERKVNPSAPRLEGPGLLSLPAGRQGLTLSGASFPPKGQGLALPNGSMRI